MAGPDFLAITGATTTGKTALALALADALDGEIVSMDSRQLYVGMDVATDKVPAHLRAQVPHFGLDLRDPSERYSAGEFGRDARGWIRGIRARSRVPILAGGTGFFLKALMEPIFDEPPLDWERTNRLRRLLKTWDRSELERWVKALDPKRAPVALQGGPHRLIRTLEISLLTGHTLSWWHRTAEPAARPLEAVVVVLELPRDELYRRIGTRVDRMVERGLVEEVRALAARGLDVSDPGMSGTGYPEILEYLEGRWTLDEALDAIRRATRRYARRQMTWFRNQLPGDTARIDAMEPVGRQATEVARLWRRAHGDVGTKREVVA